MANSGVEWQGLDELRAALHALPGVLLDGARAIVTKHATEAHDAIVAGYPTYAARLRRSVSIRALSSDGNAIVFQVRNTAPDATWFEWGTQVRRTVMHPANRGAMPPGRVMVPIAIRSRTAMVAELIAFVRAQGLTVGSDDGATDAVDE